MPCVRAVLDRVLLAEGHIHGSLGQRPRNWDLPNLTPKSYPSANTASVAPATNRNCFLPPLLAYRQKLDEGIESFHRPVFRGIAGTLSFPANFPPDLPVGSLAAPVRFGNFLSFHASRQPRPDFHGASRTHRRSLPPHAAAVTLRRWRRGSDEAAAVPLQRPRRDSNHPPGTDACGGGGRRDA